jgi:uncharacterized membrane protein
MVNLVRALYIIMADLKTLITFAAALGCALMAGLFFAFSVSIMNALSRMPSASGIAAMQSINIAIVNPVFLIVFLGTAITCLLAVIIAITVWNHPNSKLQLIGGLVYLFGSLLVTVIFNIPKNNALAVVDAVDPQSAAVWHEYLRSWSAWNHVRGLAALGATVALLLSLRNV